jgi:hypothetical protein
MNLETNTPYTFKEWSNLQSVDITNISYEKYKTYLKGWYNNRTSVYLKSKLNLKENYIQLLKDLSYLFSEDEKDKFIKFLNYDSDDDLIYTIPFFVKKLKDISKVLIAKRENIKKSKNKFNMIGSNQGLETILYEYILKNFTKKEKNLTQIPTSVLSKFLPSLSSVKDNFYIEIEELYDNKNYHDSDPSLDIKEYQNFDIENQFPFEKLSEEELSYIIATKLFDRVSNDTISKIYNDLNSDPLNSLSATKSIYYSKLNQKFLGEPVYSLTALRLKETDISDYNFDLNFTIGNNWFYWPSGNKSFKLDEFSNFFEPITLNESNLINSGATGGIDYTNSDLIFSDKNGIIEGAWFQSEKIEDVKDVMEVSILPGQLREFIYPFCGFELTETGSNFRIHSLNDDQIKIFDFFEPEKKKEILNDYYSADLPNYEMSNLYINNTELARNGAFAGITSDKSDLLTVYPNYRGTNEDVHSDSIDGTTESAFLYRIHKTDLPIYNEVSYIYWPYLTYTNSSENLPITILSDSCLPINLKEISISTMIGAVAGYDFDTSDVILKLNTRTGEPVEAAYLKSSSTDSLDQYYGNIPIYDTEAIKCSKYIRGAIQSALWFKADAGQKISFIWGDVDTYADEVFKYYDHSDACVLKNIFSDFYPDQDFVNMEPINDKADWNKCTCKSVYFSPIGHSGESIFDYNNMADILFHDVDGIGDNFTFNSWKDTRGLEVDESPQFSYFKLKDARKKVGWGEGYWQTGSGERMVLKTGRRYTYWRTSLRKNLNETISPYFVIKYPYRKIVGSNADNEECAIHKKADLVFIIDISRTQTNVLEANKKIISEIHNNILNDKGLDYKISVIAFAKDTFIVNYLSKESGKIDLSLQTLKIPEGYPNFITNIYDGIRLAEYILKNPIFIDPNTNKIEDSDYLRLCSELQNIIIESSNEAVKIINAPRSDARKKIVIFSDGAATPLTDINNIKYDEKTIIDYVKQNLKNFDIHAIDIGAYSTTNNLMEKIANPRKENYFNLQRFLVSGEGKLSNFIDYILQKIKNDICGPITPRWMKAIKNNLGQWIGTNQETDMVIRPGDYLSYIHRPSVLYVGYGSDSFELQSIGFTINVKLNGWDYNNATFSNLAIGPRFGMKPIWAKAYSEPDVQNNFNKETSIFGGHLRFINGYIPVTQPEMSKIALKKENFIRYKRRNEKILYWKQPIVYQTKTSVNKWKKLLFLTTNSNLKDILKNNTIEKYAVSSDEDSEMTLESYSAFVPAKYNYFARSPFTYNQNLNYIDRDLNSFVIFNSGNYIVPETPHQNSFNTRFPTIASVQFTSDLVSEKQNSYYLSSPKLGISHYLGKGYLSEISNDKIDMIKSLSGETVFYDLEKYSGRYRGFSKNDQYTITEIKNIDTEWISEYEYCSKKSGMMKTPWKYQKFTPYQSGYETKNKQLFGISRQDDDMELWSPVDPLIWKDSKNYPLNYKNELPVPELLKKINSLLCNFGIMTHWKTDIYGNEFGLFKRGGDVLTTELDIDILTEYLEQIYT